MIYTMADLHGEFDRYQAMLERIRFSPEDTLYILGDVVDRGGIGGIDILLDIMDRPNVTMLLGNHENMCLKAIDHPDDQRAVNHWLPNGGQATYDALCRLEERDRDRVLNFLRSLPDQRTVEAGGRRFCLVHAFPSEDSHQRIWARPGPQAVTPFADGTIVVAGHTPVCEFWGSDEDTIQKYLLGREQVSIFQGPGYFNIDCACGYQLPQRRLACLALETLEAYYT